MNIQEIKIVASNSQFYKDVNTRSETKRLQGGPQGNYGWEPFGFSSIVSQREDGSAIRNRLRYETFEIT
jgi:hypothetical protein